MAVSERYTGGKNMICLYYHPEDLVHRIPPEVQTQLQQIAEANSVHLGISELTVAEIAEGRLTLLPFSPDHPDFYQILAEAQEVSEAQYRMTETFSELTLRQAAVELINSGIKKCPHCNGDPDCDLQRAMDAEIDRRRREELEESLAAMEEMAKQKALMGIAIRDTIREMVADGDLPTGISEETVWQISQTVHGAVRAALLEVITSGEVFRWLIEGFRTCIGGLFR